MKTPRGMRSSQPPTTQEKTTKRKAEPQMKTSTKSISSSVQSAQSAQSANQSVSSTKERIVQGRPPKTLKSNKQLKAGGPMGSRDTERAKKGARGVGVKQLKGIYIYIYIIFVLYII